MTTITNINEALTKANELHASARTCINGVVHRDDSILDEWYELITNIAEALGVNTEKVCKMATDLESHGDAHYSESHHYATPLVYFC